MLKTKVIKISLSVSVLLIALWFATPRTYINFLFPFSGNSLSLENQTKLQSPEPSDIEEYNKPVYFNIFKFVNNFIPSKR
ncbi:MAG: hypothetical protein JNJ41_12400 [Bacteroidia bacterium]|nr:hypothetical protein [Bacteroidia bacterium]